MRKSILTAVLCCAAQALVLPAGEGARAEDARAEQAATSSDKDAMPWERSTPAAAGSSTKPDPEPVSGEQARIEPKRSSAPEAAPKPEAKTEPKTEPKTSPEAEAGTKTETTTEEAAASPAPSELDANLTSSGQAGTEQGEDATPDVSSPAVSNPVAVPPGPPHPVVAIIREKLTDGTVTKKADSDDIAALKAFYETHGAPPLWMTEMGFSTKGQAVIFEIEKADDWGLEAKDFTLPDAGLLPADETAQALAEIELNLALLKYARFARGGRYVPAQVSRLFDQKPPLREPGAVIAEIGATGAPAVYLRSLHPEHEQFQRLRDALAEERGAEKPNDTDIRRLLINMERWRWMPEDLGALHVWLNTPEFMLYVKKDGETIYEDKTLVGTRQYATPIFTANMETVVFNPNWVAPPSVLRDKLWPALKRKSYSILTSNKLNVSYKGKRIDPKKVDWNRVNIHNYTFSQKAGPKNVLGKAKFLYPNKHIVYMHDTLPSWDKSFKKDRRAVGNACVRMENPDKFAALVLEQDQEFPSTKVKSLWDKGVNSSVKMTTKPPVHTTYFTVRVDDEGKVSKFKDLYGLDRKTAKAFFGSTTGFPEPPPEPKQRASRSVASSSSSNRGNSGGGFTNSLDFFNN